MERALLVRKSETKKSRPVEIEADTNDGLTKRMLLSMVFDVSQLEKTVERVKVQVFTLAKAHGIVPPSGADED